MSESMHSLFPIYQVDAFAARPFLGNPAGVCYLMAPRPDTWMQSVAAEMNLSETAFVFKQADVYHLRWFTPTTEVDLCGHATLATAHIIWETSLELPEATLRFQTRSGILTARREGEWIVLDFPAGQVQAATAPEGLAQALGTPVIRFAASPGDWIAEVRDEVTLRSLQPDMAALAQYPARGIIVTAAAASGDLDFVSRFFGPAVGVPEDPVTGSAHCMLAPYWAPRLGKTAMTGYQASERGGIVKVVLQGDRVLLKGKAVTVFQGVLTGEGARADIRED